MSSRSIVKVVFGISTLLASLLSARRHFSQQLYQETSDWIFSPSIAQDKLHDKVTGSNSFSACLAWMDDLEILVEWIAYHFHVLNLRYLVVYRDPKSVQNLDTLVERWRAMMEIVVWDDPNIFLPHHLYQTIFNLTDEATKWRMLQTEFYRHCSFHLQGRNRTWTTFIDTDEYVSFDARYAPNTTERIRHHGSIFEFLADQQDRKSRHFHAKFHSPCITLARNQYTALESHQDEVARNVPSFLDPYRLQTLRFRHSMRDVLIGKTIADVSRLEFNYPKKIWMHRLFPHDKACDPPYGHKKDPLVINHYVGSWQAFQRPNDRRPKDRYQKWLNHSLDYVKKRGPPRGDEIRNWISGFVDFFGESETLRLLDGVGFSLNTTTAMPVYNVSCDAPCVQKYRLGVL